MFLGLNSKDSLSLFSGRYWELLGGTGSYWEVLGDTGRYWEILGGTGSCDSHIMDHGCGPLVAVVLLDTHVSCYNYYL